MDNWKDKFQDKTEEAKEKLEQSYEDAKGGIQDIGDDTDDEEE